MVANELCFSWAAITRFGRFGSKTEESKGSVDRARHQRADRLGGASQPGSALASRLSSLFPSAFLFTRLDIRNMPDLREISVEGYLFLWSLSFASLICYWRA